MALYNYALATDRARQAECASNLRTLGYALCAYRFDYNDYPVGDGVAGDSPSPMRTSFGNGPAGGGYWNGVPLILVELGYISNRNILYCPVLRKHYPNRRENLRYAYNYSTSGAGGYMGSQNGAQTDSADVWLARCLLLRPERTGLDGQSAVPFPHGLERDMENVLFVNMRVELRTGGEKTP